MLLMCLGVLSFMSAEDRALHNSFSSTIFGINAFLNRFPCILHVSTNSKLGQHNSNLLHFLLGTAGLHGPTSRLQCTWRSQNLRDRLVCHSLPWKYGRKHNQYEHHHCKSEWASLQSASYKDATHYILAKALLYNPLKIEFHVQRPHTMSIVHACNSINLFHAEYKLQYCLKICRLANMDLFC